MTVIILQKIDKGYLQKAVAIAFPNQETFLLPLVHIHPRQSTVLTGLSFLADNDGSMFHLLLQKDAKIQLSFF